MAITLKEKFIKFHLKNPHVYEMLATLCFKVQEAGFKKFSIAQLFEQLRWHYRIETVDTQFKLCNSYRAFYARLLMEKNPELNGFFLLRKQTSVNKTVIDHPVVLAEDLNPERLVPEIEKYRETNEKLY